MKKILFAAVAAVALLFMFAGEQKAKCRKRAQEDINEVLDY